MTVHDSSWQWHDSSAWLKPTLCQWPCHFRMSTVLWCAYIFETFALLFNLCDVHGIIAEITLNLQNDIELPIWVTSRLWKYLMRRWCPSHSIISQQLKILQMFIHSQTDYQWLTLFADRKNCTHALESLLNLCIEGNLPSLIRLNCGNEDWMPFNRHCKLWKCQIFCRLKMTQLNTSVLHNSLWFSNVEAGYN